ncbi:CapA family protein [Mucilaginibacter sp. AW1-7]|uniref:CapA family protein n=1 Tax=Mucilaginibacter sp. AW1-7 TaxID=3349874 RepID=UPI003F732360
MKGLFFYTKPCSLPVVTCLVILLQACQTPPPKHVAVKQQKAAVPKPTPPKPQPIVPDSLCIAAMGDIMLGTSYPNNATLPPDSAINSFNAVKPDLKGANVIFGNLEGSLLDSGDPAHYKLHQKSKAFLFRMPTKYASVLKSAGFNVLSLANNHIGDFDIKGRNSTTQTLDSLGIHYAGLLIKPSTVFEVNGIKYGFCSFAPNANTVPILDLKGAASIISELKQRCDVVIVSFHGGGEGVDYEHVPRKMESYINEKRGDVYAFAHNAIDAGADLIFGNGPHVNRAMELYKNRLIAYSLGNFCTYRSVSVAGVCGFAPLLKVYVNKKGEFLKGNIISFRQTHDSGLKRDTLNSAATRIRMLSDSDFAGGGLHISDRGEVVVPQEELSSN